MIYPAFDAREVAGEVLLKDRSLMELWKWASNEGQILAVNIKGKNYAVVKDEDLVARIRATAGGLKEHRYDDEISALV